MYPCDYSDNGWFPCSTFTGLLALCGQQSDVNTIVGVLNSMVAMNVLPTTEAVSAVVSAMVAANRLQDAILFAKLCGSNGMLVSGDGLIDCQGHSRPLLTYVCVLMLVQPPTSAYRRIIRACKQLVLDSCSEGTSELPTLTLDPSSSAPVNAMDAMLILWSDMVVAGRKTISGKTLRAEAVMICEDVLIAGYIAANAGIAVNVATLRTRLIDGIEGATKQPVSVEVFTAMLSCAISNREFNKPAGAASKAAQWAGIAAECDEIVALMKDKGVKHTLLTFNLLIRACVRCDAVAMLLLMGLHGLLWLRRYLLDSKADRALDILFSDMKAASCPPNVNTYLTLMLHLNDDTAALRVVDHMKVRCTVACAVHAMLVR